MINSAIRIKQYAGNDVATVFSTVFVFYRDSHVYVYTTDDAGVVETLVLDSDYTLTGVGGVGSVTLSVALPSTKTLTIARIVPYEQLTDYVNNDNFDSEAHEAQMDLIVMMIQQLADPNGVPGSASLKFPITEPLDFNTTLPNANVRKDSVFYLDPDTGEFTTLTLAALAQRLLVILGAESVLPYRTREITESITLAQSDVNSSIRANSVADIEITLPLTAEISENFFCTLSRFGTGAVTFIAPPGVVIDSDGGKDRIFGQKTAVGIQIIGTNRWWVFGDLY